MISSMRSADLCSRTCVTILAAALSINAQAPADHAQHHQQQVSILIAGQKAVQLPVLIDGAKTPDQISDDLAYQHFFLIAAEDPLAPPSALARQNSLVAPINLSPVDKRALVQQLSIFKGQLDDIDRPRTDGAADSATVVRQRKDLVTATITHLNASLTREGVSRLKSYVQTEVKRRIVIYGTNQ